MNDDSQKSTLQELLHFSGNSVRVSILRLDLIHPVVSGNKWFKLRYYLEEALSQRKTMIATFGGAYSNHIVATAFASKAAGLKSTGYIRGEEAPQPGATLLHAHAYGMETIFINRETFQNKQAIIEKFNHPETYWIREGGYGMTGARGAADILTFPGMEAYTHILCATGTGTMMAGLIKAAAPQQEIVGISVLKNQYSLENEVQHLLNEQETPKKYSFIHGYHFGGYAKHPETLIKFMNQVWQNWELPTDIVYTAKLVFAAKDLITKNHFPPNSHLLLIHSGGLQGNLSLPPNTLPF